MYRLFDDISDPTACKPPKSHVTHIVMVFFMIYRAPDELRFSLGDKLLTIWLITEYRVRDPIVVVCYRAM
jgi:hypothetical protein